MHVKGTILQMEAMQVPATLQDQLRPTQSPLAKTVEPRLRPSGDEMMLGTSSVMLVVSQGCLYVIGMGVSAFLT